MLNVIWTDRFVFQSDTQLDTTVNNVKYYVLCDAGSNAGCDLQNFNLLSRQICHTQPYQALNILRERGRQDALKIDLE
jgi:hypothetical protein